MRDPTESNTWGSERGCCAPRPTSWRSTSCGEETGCLASSWEKPLTGSSSAAPRTPEADLWPIGQRETLPVIPVPLRPGEEARLDLQALLHRVYNAAGYEDYIYAGRPQPALSAEDAT